MIETAIETLSATATAAATAGGYRHASASAAHQRIARCMVGFLVVSSRSASLQARRLKGCVAAGR